RMNNNNFPLAIKTLSEALKIKGRVYPSSLDLIRLAAEFEDGEISFGETCIVSKNKRIKRIWLDGNAEAFEESVLAIKNADLIVLGPGSLYTSIIPNILVDGIRNAINTNHNKKVYVANIMTQPGETTGYTLKDHVNEIENYLGQRLDYIIANSSNLPIQVIDRYKEMGATQVLIDIDGDQRLIKSDLVYIINQERPIVRHDPKKISELIVKCIN
ncbi:MAG: gluconeogenesis factor YvcK family protein, partial [Defluviitoga tunisiensis]